MIAIAYYLLKVILCSGILFSYYHLVLRNKAFHQWNRFYLLGAVVVSLTVPLIKFTVEQTPDTAPFLFTTTQSADVFVLHIQKSSPSITAEQWIMIAYAVVSLGILMLLLRSLITIHKIIKQHQVHIIDNIRFVDTEVKGTPFSFLQYIFWNHAINLNTETGKQIFQHELVHVRERHTLDKLFLQIVLCLFWCNPFFWLVRRELTMIHEFIADKKAVKEYGTKAFAAMILQTVYPQHYNALTNSFFQSSIKRRIAMITKINNPRWSYIRRILALPLLTVTMLFFTLRTEAKRDQHANELKTDFVNVIDNNVNDTIPKLKQDDSNKSKTDNSKLPTQQQWLKAANPNALYMIDGKHATEAEIKALDPASIESVNVLKDAAATKLYGEKGKNGVIEIKTKPVAKIKTAGNEPLYVWDGLVITPQQVAAIDPNAIASIDVLKGEAATKLYGEKGKNGVVVIKTKDMRKASGELILHADSMVIHEAPKVQIDNKPVFNEVETPPSIDQKVWRQFLEENLQAFIENAAAKGMKPGTYLVPVRFIVDIDGSISKIESLSKHGYGLEEGVEVMMKASPKWRPAKQNGRTVRAYHTQPITFVIAEEDEKPKKIDINTRSK
jgi:TonB-dependent SusC/RagA subfamily outer membrane receptor